VPWLFGWPKLADPDLNKTFDVALHLGTLAGALAYFRRDVGRYLAAWVRSIRTRSVGTVDERLAWALVVGTLPGVVAGATLENVVQEQLGRPLLIAAMLAVFGVLLYVVDRRAAERRSISDLRVRDGLALGVAQALALQPGVSRSGVTITAARAMGLDRASAARFSFLLSLPIIAGAGVFKGLDLLRTGMPPGMGGPFAWGICSSAASGFLVIAFLLSYLRRHDVSVFLWYRLAVAALTLGVVLAGIRPAGA
jgi:undecaprenyl-diphosphatase